MAAAEARAVWQRTANRCFVQEDAKRAPKLPGPTPPSSSSSEAASAHADTKTNYNNTNSDTDEPHQHIIPNLTPLPWNPYPISAANLPADTRWWLQLHPSFAYQREFLIYEPKNNALTNPASDDSDKADPPKSSLFMSFVKHGGGGGGSAEKLRCDAKPCEDPFAPPKKSEPWWRVIADGEELAWMVAQKAAAQNVENCDLPRPSQTLCIPCGDHLTRAFGDVNFVDPAAYYYEDPLRINKLVDTERSTRSEEQGGSNVKREKGSREELLEALCHSQTRAREAEIAAKKAHSEKEDIIKLLFRQASHLFACKQWLKMLQLENLCLQLRIRDHQFPFPFNSKSPPPPVKKPGKARTCNNICRYVVVFAVGLGLAGAGLLFGWTLGWLLPKF